MNLEDLPTEILAKLLKFFAYDELSRLRLISQKFNLACRQALNSGFQRAEKYQLSLAQKLKVQLPRRESERRTHGLSRHSDVLGAVETRLSLLTMTYNKYIEAGVCCFIPGKVLDELYRVLRVIDASLKTSGTSPNNQLSKPHELLQELRDISSMAMEYFDEKLLADYRDEMANRLHATSTPDLVLPNRLLSDFSASFNSLGSCESCCAKIRPKPNLRRNRTWSRGQDTRLVEGLHRRLKIQRSEIAYLKQQVYRMKILADKQNRRIKEQNQSIQSQAVSKIDTDKKLDELSTKLIELSAELRRKTAKCGKRGHEDETDECKVAAAPKFLKM